MKKYSVKINAGELHLCCKDLHDSFFSGTDNEGYGSLSSNWAATPSAISIGCDLPSIKFCPWCGTPTDKLTLTLK